jgi:DNA polymerase-1
MSVDIETLPFYYQDYMKEGKAGKTDVFRDKLYLIGVSTSKGQQKVLNVLNRDGKPKPLPDWFINMYQDNSTLVLMHNGAFDAKYLWHHYKIKPKNLHDTMVAERLLTMGKGIRVGLKNVLERRYGVKLDKDIREQICKGQLSEKDYNYVLGDTQYLQLLWEDQTQEISENGMNHAMYLENRLAWICAMMEYTGMPFDRKLWANYHKILVDVRNKYNIEALKKLGVKYSLTYSGEPVDCLNLCSTQQAINLLGRNGINLENYQKKSILEYILTSKQEDKKQIMTDVYQLKKWISALRFDYAKEVHPFTRRLHGRTIPTGTNTGRFSSKSPNLQNISKDMDYDRYLQKTGVNFRKLFKAPKGWNWIASDYSQIELRILADTTNEKWLINDFVNDGDPHSSAASMVLGIPVNKSMVERNYGKVVNFGVAAYGGGVDALIGYALNMGMVIPLDKAENIVNKIKIGNKNIENWGKSVLREAKKNRYLQHSAGYKRWFIDDKDLRETTARNTPIQGTAGAIMKEATVNFYDWIEKTHGHKNVKILNIVHDEINSICREEYSEDVLKNKNRIMIEAGTKYMEKVPCEVDGSIGKTWAEAK